jgi:mutator protein MutT
MTEPWPPIGVAAKAIVRRPDGRVLLIRRPTNTDWHPGAWDLPGGKMDLGETLPEVLAREVREETGLEVEVGETIHISHFTKDPYWVTCVTYVCDVHDEEPRLSDEHSEFDWIDAHALGGRTYAPAIREQLDAYAASRRDS